MHNYEPRSGPDKDLAPVTLVKNGLAIGGASLADVALLNYLQRQGHEVSILTGYINSSLEVGLKTYGIGVCVDVALDRDNLEDVDKLRAVTVGYLATKGGVAIFSQSLCNAEQRFGSEVLEVAKCFPSVFRQHNHISENLRELYGQATNGVTAAITETLRTEFAGANPNIPAYTLPPYVNSERFVHDPAAANNIRHNVRQHLGIDQDAIVLLQPTRVHRQKGIEYAIGVAMQLEKAMGRSAILLVAGGNEQFADSSLYKKELKNLAGKKGFNSVEFLNGLYHHTTHRRIADLMIASDAIVFPGVNESFGLGITEAALCNVPVIAKRFRGEYGEHTFDEVYGDFDIITDYVDAIEPSASVIDNMVDVLLDSRRRLEMTSKNILLAQRYVLTDSVYDVISKILLCAVNS